MLHPRPGAKFLSNDMSTLITGARGFIGSVLAQELGRENKKLFGLSREKANIGGSIKFYRADIVDRKEIFSIIKRVRPNYIYHLAAQSSVVGSFTSPNETFQTNILGTLNILDAVKNYVPKTSLVSVGSSAEYGRATKQADSLSEATSCLPTSPYGLSKVAQGQLVAIYAKTYGIKAFHVRPFAVIGPGKIGDAISDFARGIVEIENGVKRSLSVGRLDYIRDFVDVRDAVTAMKLIAQKGKSLTYNVCLGQGHTLSEILEILVSYSRAKITIKKDPSKIRSVDDPVLLGNPSKLFALGFKPKYSIEASLKSILDYWRVQKVI